MDNSAYTCPQCGAKAPLVVSNFGFAFAPSAGPTANSGVHDQDYPTADKAVGRSAESRWQMIREREAVKKEAREKGGTHALIRHQGDDYIDYEPMSGVGRDARRKLTRAAFAASKKR